MRLVADSLYQVERLRVARQQDRYRLTREENLFVLLRQTTNRHHHANFVEGFERCVELTLAAIDDHQIGQGGPFAVTLFVGLGRAPEPAPNHLLHHREVIRALDRFDREPAVLSLRRFSVLEHDHAGNRVGALDIRYVKAFDAARHARKIEGIGELGERRRGAHFVRQELHSALLEVVDGTFGNHLDERPLFAAPRNDQLDAPLAAIAKPLRNDWRFRFRQGVLQHDHRRDYGRFRIKLRHESGNDLFRCVFHIRLHREELTTEQFAVAKKPDLHPGVAACALRDGDDVRVGAPGTDDFLALEHMLDGGYAIAKLGGSLEVPAV